MSTTDSEYSSEVSISSDDNAEHNDNLDLTNSILGKYNIIRELGRGTFSIVWLAYDTYNDKFYAIKVQDPNEFDDGLDEVKFVKKLPKDKGYFNYLIDSFIERHNNNKYLCSVWELHYSDADYLIRKGCYTNGFPLHIVKKIMKQLIYSLYILHNKYKVFHGDLKPDNILIRGINNYDNFIINKYKESDFKTKYKKALDELSTSKIANSKTSIKSGIRKRIHQEIMNNINKEITNLNIDKHSTNSKYLESINISLSDFGTHCEEDDYYSEPFGTRYYQAPEIILMGKCSFPVDIWALGCTFYELLTGHILFNPNKCSKYSRDYNHLYLIKETCGDFPINFLKTTKHYKKYFDNNYKLFNDDIDNYNRLDRKLECLSVSDSDKNKIKELLVSMLHIDISKRIKINDLIKNDFFN
jgi:serine/threonine-protein kinase SRPK3